MPWWLRLAFMAMAIRGDNIEGSLQQMGYMVRPFLRSDTCNNPLTVYSPSVLARGEKGGA
jgi:hypothetical protein